MNGLPTWEELVLAMYFDVVSSEEIIDDQGQRWKPFPNYLYAIAEWQLERTTVAERGTGGRVEPKSRRVDSAGRGTARNGDPVSPAQ